MTNLSNLEQAVLDKCLEGEHPVLCALREQQERASFTRREHTGVGFFCEFEVPDDARLAHLPDFEIADVSAQIAGLDNGAGFVLFFRRGRIEMLEGFSYGEPWPSSIVSFRLEYMKTPRDMSMLSSVGPWRDR